MKEKDFDSLFNMYIDENTNKDFIVKHIMPIANTVFFSTSTCCNRQLCNFYKYINLNKSKNFNKKDALVDLIYIYIVLNKQHSEIEHLKTELEAYKEQYSKILKIFKEKVGAI